MSSIKMVALRKHPFGTGEREAGDEYQATPDESAILIALGWAKKVSPKAEKPSPAPAPSTPASPAPVADAPSAETGAAAEDASKEIKPTPTTTGRTYQRRDMRVKS